MAGATTAPGRRAIANYCSSSDVIFCVFRFRAPARMPVRP